MDWPMLSPPSDRYRSDIDGLRAIAVMLVVNFHAFPEAMPGGFIGVDIFFVISGFLITGIIARELDQQRFSIMGFYNRRIRRIFPALIVVLGATLVLSWLRTGTNPACRIKRRVRSPVNNKAAARNRASRARLLARTMEIPKSRSTNEQLRYGQFALLPR
jgi:peptidoglycan/LPS O-acetylase OafA/YrhL